MDASRERSYIRGELGKHLRHVSYYLGPATRQAYWNGGCDLVPNNFSEMPALLRQATRCSLVLAAASPPDPHGYFSLGTNAEYTAAFIGEVPFFLEVNERMPHTYGENQLHISELAGWIHTDRALTELPHSVPDQRDHQIAAYVAERIRDGSCLQVGVGNTPNALLSALADHRELG